MRIVIIGEFSSFAKNLSEGFRQLGHECFVFSWGDGFKKISQEDGNSYQIQLKQSRSHGLLRKVYILYSSIIAAIKLRKTVRKMSNGNKWNVALVINPVFIKDKRSFWSATFSSKMIRSLLSSPHNIYISACGGDVPFFDYWKDHPWKNYHMVEVGMAHYYSNSQKRHFKYCVSFINHVIPVSYMYAEAWRKSIFSRDCTVLPTIPLPVATQNFAVSNTIGEKVVIFHGIIRPEEKGTPFIVKAMDMLQEKYPDQVECIAKGGMPLNEYLPLLNRTNILIDQVYSDSVGLNGLYALAMGKVVLGGNVLENQKEFGGVISPVINIEPNVEDIFSKLDSLVCHREMIAEISKKSRDYVVKTHDARVIAGKYIDLFSGKF